MARGRNWPIATKIHVPWLSAVRSRAVSLAQCEFCRFQPQCEVRQFAGRELGGESPPRGRGAPLTSARLPPARRETAHMVAVSSSRSRMFFDRVYTSFLSSAHAADLRVMLRSPFSTPAPCRAEQCRTRTRCAQLLRLSSPAMMDCKEPCLPPLLGSSAHAADGAAGLFCHCDILRRYCQSVVNAAKRTANGRQYRAARSRMTLANDFTS